MYILVINKQKQIIYDNYEKQTSQWCRKQKKEKTEQNVVIFQIKSAILIET